MHTGSSEGNEDSTFMKSKRVRTKSVNYSIDNFNSAGGADAQPKNTQSIYHDQVATNTSNLMGSVVDPGLFDNI